MDIFSRQITSMHAAALIIGAAGFLSRLLGLLRDRLLASQFGAGKELDIYYVSFQIPDFMNVLFLLGAGSAAILPIFQEYLVKDREEARRLISDLCALFLVGSGVLALAAFIFTPSLLSLVAPGFSYEDRITAIMLTRIMLFSPILFGLSGIFTSVVESFQRFLAYAIAPILYNLGIISGILFFVPSFGMRGLAFGVILGALLHLTVHLITIKRLGFAPQIRWRGITEGVKKVVGLSFPRVVSVSLSHFTGFILIAIGSTLTEGSISVFQLAQNLYFVPIGVFGASYSVVLFPRLSRAYITKDANIFFTELFIGIRSVLFWILPFTALFIVLRAHIVRAALGAGAFSWEDTRLTAAVLAILVFSLFANALLSLLIKGFYALENTWRPLVINISASAVSIISALFFVRILGGTSEFANSIAGSLRISDFGDIRVLALAIGLSGGLIINVFLLYGALIRLAASTFKEVRVLPIFDILKIVFASLCGGVAAYVIRASFSEAIPLISFFRVLWQGGMAGGIGMAVYFGVLLLLKEESVWSLWQTLHQRIFKLKILPPSWNGETHINQHRI